MFDIFPVGFTRDEYIIFWKSVLSDKNFIDIWMLLFGVIGII